MFRVAGKAAVRVAIVYKMAAVSGRMPQCKPAGSAMAQHVPGLLRFNSVRPGAEGDPPAHLEYTQVAVRQDFVRIPRNSTAQFVVRHLEPGQTLSFSFDTRDAQQRADFIAITNVIPWLTFQGTRCRECAHQNRDCRVFTYPFDAGSACLECRLNRHSCSYASDPPYVELRQDNHRAMRLLHENYGFERRHTLHGMSPRDFLDRLNAESYPANYLLDRAHITRLAYGEWQTAQQQADALHDVWIRHLRRHEAVRVSRGLPFPVEPALTDPNHNGLEAGVPAGLAQNYPPPTYGVAQRAAGPAAPAQGPEGQPSLTDLLAERRTQVRTPPQANTGAPSTPTRTGAPPQPQGTPRRVSVAVGTGFPVLPGQVPSNQARETSRRRSARRIVSDNTDAQEAEPSNAAAPSQDSAEPSGLLDSEQRAQMERDHQIAREAQRALNQGSQRETRSSARNQRGQ